MVKQSPNTPTSPSLPPFHPPNLPASKQELHNDQLNRPKSTTPTLHSVHNTINNVYASTPFQPPYVRHSLSTGILSKRNSLKFHKKTPATPCIHSTRSKYISSTDHAPIRQFPLFNKNHDAGMQLVDTPLFAPATSLGTSQLTFTSQKKSQAQNASISSLPLQPNLLTMDYFVKASNGLLGDPASNQNTPYLKAGKHSLKNYFPFSNQLSDSSSFIDTNYRIGTILGRGSLSSVYEVSNTKTNRLYALKKTTKPYKGKLNRQHILEEVWIWHIIGVHPNIVQLECAWELSGHLYMVMELCSGGTLGELLIRRARCPLPELEVCEILTDIALGLAWMHSRNVAHLDLKPDNVFLTLHGRCKLGDFGISTLLRKPSPEKCSLAFKEFGPLNWAVIANGFCTFREAQEREGDPVYSPKEITNDIYGCFTDVFAFGIIFLEMMTNTELPIGNDTDMYAPLRNGDISQFENEFPEMISATIKETIRKCLCPTYSLRPTIAEILLCEPFCTINTEERQQYLSENQSRLPTPSINLTAGNPLITPPPAIPNENPGLSSNSDAIANIQASLYCPETSTVTSKNSMIESPCTQKSVQIRSYASPSLVTPRTPRRLNSETIVAASTGGTTRKASKRTLSRTPRHHSTALIDKNDSRKHARVPISPISFTPDQLLLPQNNSSFPCITSSWQHPSTLTSTSSHSTTLSNEGPVTPRPYPPKNKQVHSFHSDTFSSQSTSDTTNNNSPLALRSFPRVCGAASPYQMTSSVSDSQSSHAKGGSSVNLLHNLRDPVVDISSPLGQFPKEPTLHANDIDTVMEDVGT